MRRLYEHQNQPPCSVCGGGAAVTFIGLEGERVATCTAIGCRGGVIEKRVAAKVANIILANVGADYLPCNDPLTDASKGLTSALWRTAATRRRQHREDERRAELLEAAKAAGRKKLRVPGPAQEVTDATERARGYASKVRSYMKRSDRRGLNQLVDAIRRLADAIDPPGLDAGTQAVVVHFAIELEGHRDRVLDALRQPAIEGDEPVDQLDKAALEAVLPVIERGIQYESKGAPGSRASPLRSLARQLVRLWDAHASHPARISLVMVAPTADGQLDSAGVLLPEAELFRASGVATGLVDPAVLAGSENEVEGERLRSVWRRAVEDVR